MSRPTTISLILAGIAIGLVNAVSLAAPPSDAKSFIKRTEPVCVIEGQWSDGEPFHYQAWDTCAAIEILRGKQAMYADATPRGEDKRLSGKDIPLESEVIEISNAFSAVIVFRDAHGKIREIMIRD